MNWVEIIILIIQGISSLYLLSSFLSDKREKKHEDRIFMTMCGYSFLWEVGELLLTVSKTETYAYISYILVRIGFFLWIVGFQFLICYFIKIKKGVHIYIHTMEVIGGLIVAHGLWSSNITFQKSGYGYSIIINNSKIVWAYIGFVAWFCLNLLIFAIAMYRQSHYRRMKSMSKRLIAVAIVLCLGFVGDYYSPQFNYVVSHTSVIGQFIALVVVAFGLRWLKSCEINQVNMSEFIFSSMASPVLVYDMEGTLQLANEAARTSLQVEEREIKNPNSRISDVFDIDEEDVFFYDEKTNDVEAVCKRTEALCELTVNGINDRYGDAIGYIIIVGDLTEKLETMKQLKEAKEEADDANYAKSAFLANMSHEIRTPMNAIVGFSELILSEEIPEQIRDYVVDIRNSSHNLLAIINDILDVSKIESKKMELVEGEYYIRNLFDDVYMIINAQATKRNLKFSMNIEGDIPCQMFGDMIRIRGILINILNNSVKYTDEGSVTLTARVASREKYIANLEFKVADTGIGITEEDQKVMFESFSQVDKTVNHGKEGTGLGLSIVKGFVDLMGGTIEVESEYGKGTTFTVTIPQRVLDENPMAPIDQKKEEHEEEYGLGQLSIENVRVLVVDDNAINLKMASHSMEHYGLRVDTVNSGKKAIEMCKETKYPIVFMDQMMPEMDGIQAMKQIRELDSYYAPGGEAKIVILTANAMSGVRDELLSEGFDEFLGKPINFKELEELLRGYFPDQIK